MGILGLLGGLGSKIVDIVDKHVKNQAEKEKITLEIQKAYMEHLAKVEEMLTEKQADIIVAEATGHSWLQRNWRPLTMLVFVSIIANNYILVPYAHALFNFDLPVLKLPDQVWELIKYGLTGYLGARSLEKITGMATSAVLAKKKLETLKDSVESVVDEVKERVPKLTDFNLDIDTVEKLGSSKKK